MRTQRLWLSRDPSGAEEPGNGKIVYPTDKTIDQLAREVISGKWGNGEERKRRLTQAGYDYKAVQKIVNSML